MKFRLPHLLLAASLALQAQTRPVVDMTGKSVQVPLRVHSVYAPTPDAYYLLLAVAPDLMSGLLMPLKEEEKPFLNPVLHKLPFIGGRYNGGNTTNLEVLLQRKPDLLLLWADRAHAVPKSPEDIARLGIPGVQATLDGLPGYPTTFRFLGRLLGREAHGEQLASYAQRTLDRVQATLKRIPASHRPKVYYAEGGDGLSTEYSDSIHAEVLKLAGDCNVHRGHSSGFAGMDKVSLEQVILYNPDVLVVQERSFYDRVWSDPAWRNVKAVKEGRIYLVPRSPINWLDRPPTFMRLLGLQWLMHNLYPKDYPIDLVKEAQDFYALFLGVQVPVSDMQRVIYRK